MKRNIKKQRQIWNKIEKGLETTPEAEREMTIVLKNKTKE